MIRFDDFRSEILEDGSVLLRLLKGHPVPPDPRGLRRPGAPPPRYYPTEPQREVGYLQVGYRRADSDEPQSLPVGVTGVCLGFDEGLTPTDLQRFAWGKWLRVTETIARHADRRIGPSGFPEDAATLAKLELQGVKVVPPAKRPGRKGYETQFYEGIAQRYVALLASGERAPTKKISEEMKYSRNTVAGWVKKARRLGLLPLGRQGRAG